jgi:hypothetical protein
LFPLIALLVGLKRPLLDIELDRRVVALSAFQPTCLGNHAMIVHEKSIATNASFDLFPPWRKKILNYMHVNGFPDGNLRPVVGHLFSNALN